MVEFRVLMKLLTIVVLDSVRGRGRGPLLLQLSLDGVMGSFQSSRSFPYGFIPRDGSSRGESDTVHRYTR